MGDLNVLRLCADLLDLRETDIADANALQALRRLRGIGDHIAFIEGRRLRAETGTAA